MSDRAQLGQKTPCSGILGVIALVGASTAQNPELCFTSTIWFPTIILRAFPAILALLWFGGWMVSTQATSLLSTLAAHASASLSVLVRCLC